MKRFIIFVTCMMTVLVLSGCSMGNTPTRKVEGFLNNYNSNDSAVLEQLQEMVNSDSLMNDTQRSKYSDIMKKQYKDMTYEIKDEVIDGDNATVTAEIEVYDYYKINRESEDYYNNNQSEFVDTNNNNDSLAEDVKEGVEKAADKVTDAAENAANAVSNSKFIDYRLDKLDNTKDRVKYTIDFTLTKVDDNWKLNDIDDITRQKLHGLYEH